MENADDQRKQDDVSVLPTLVAEGKTRKRIRKEIAHVRESTARNIVLLNLLIMLTGCVHRPPLKPYVGMWVLYGTRSGDDAQDTQPIMTLQLTKHHRTLKGKLVTPTKFNEAPDGSFHDLALPLETRIIEGVRLNQPLLDLRYRGEDSTNYVPLMLIDPDHLVLGGFPGLVPPWRFDRVKTLPDITTFNNK